MTLDHPHPGEARGGQEARKAQEATTATLGFLIAALGVALLADRLHLLDVNLGQLWPLILIMIGVGKLSAPADRWEGIWWLAMGAWWLIITTTPLTISTTWPVLIIISGVLMIAESVARSAAPRRATPAPASDDNSAPAIGAIESTRGESDGQ